MYDLVAFGEILIDLSFDKEENRYLQNPGGAPFNVACVLGKYGRNVGFIGKVGIDEYGKFLKEEMDKNFINGNGLVFDDKYKTTLAIVSFNENNDREFEFIRGADNNLNIKDVNFDLIKNSRIFHFGTLLMTDDKGISVTKYALEQAKKNGCIISFDPNYRSFLWSEEDFKKAVDLVIQDVNILKVSLEEGMIISGLDNVIDIANNLFEKVKDVVIITLADEGAYYKAKESFGYIKGKKQKAVDTTGAGDIFFGTFLNEYLKEEYNISAAIKKANIAGGLSVLKKGAIPSIPNIYELEKIDD